MMVCTFTNNFQMERTAVYLQKMQAEAQQEEMRHLDEPFNVVSAFK
jgi:hypothetical protein